ncbi:hypothetical protein ACR820_19780 [Streptomyces netropsis]
MYRRLLARHRLKLRYWSLWISHHRNGRETGPRPILALHRLPDPHCTDCDGKGQVMSGVPGADEPDFDDCPCAPFLPLAWIWLPKPPGWARRSRRIAYNDEPPF